MGRSVLTKFSTSKHSYNQKALFLQGKRPNSSITMQQQSSCFMLAVLLSCALSTVFATPIPAAGTGATAAAEDAAAEAVSIVATKGEDLSETGATEGSDDAVAEGGDGTAAADESGEAEDEAGDAEAEDDKDLNEDEEAADAGAEETEEKAATGAGGTGQTEVAEAATAEAVKQAQDEEAAEGGASQAAVADVATTEV